MARIGTSRKWFNIVRRKLVRSSSHKTTVILHSDTCSPPDEPKIKRLPDEIAASYEKLISEISPSPREDIITEDKAARKIQAIFRGHLARRAFRALRSLVKLQALARGAYVRKQSRIALHCMHALVRLQVRIRARQLLGGCSNE